MARRRRVVLSPASHTLPCPLPGSAPAAEINEIKTRFGNSLVLKAASGWSFAEVMQLVTDACCEGRFGGTCCGWKGGSVSRSSFRMPPSQLVMKQWFEKAEQLRASGSRGAEVPFCGQLSIYAVPVLAT